MLMKARYVMIGGFLGAGKTTAILAIAEKLRDRGLRAGLITNDQSQGLVDTVMLSSHGFAVEQITGGCFCCRFNSLVDASERLESGSHPDVFLAEPVGSCTDLKATVHFPLRRMYGENYQIAPFSVMLDPSRAMKILGLEPGKSFSPKVRYIYEKQLEEADIIVINKVDQLSEEKLTQLRGALASRFTKATVIAVSARAGTGIEEWIERIFTDSADSGIAMDVDYDTYAEGEALLGWLNAAVELTGEEFDGNALVMELGRVIHERLKRENIEIAHLKMTLTPEEGQDLAVLNLVRSDFQPEMSHQLAEPLESGELIVNLRAEGDPDILRGIVEDVIGALANDGKMGCRVEHLESFRPGRPTPIHRIARL
jgi:G3E family GTPase